MGARNCYEKTEFTAETRRADTTVEMESINWEIDTQIAGWDRLLAIL
jgi:hypothetical protein